MVLKRGGSVRTQAGLRRGWKTTSDGVSSSNIVFLNGYFIRGSIFHHRAIRSAVGFSFIPTTFYKTSSTR